MGYMLSAAIEKVGIDIGDILYFISYSDYEVKQVIIVEDSVEPIDGQVRLSYVLSHLDRFYYDSLQAEERSKELKEAHEDLKKHGQKIFGDLYDMFLK